MEFVLHVSGHGVDGVKLCVHGLQPLPHHLLTLQTTRLMDVITAVTTQKVMLSIHHLLLQYTSAMHY